MPLATRSAVDRGGQVLFLPLGSRSTVDEGGECCACLQAPGVQWTEVVKELDYAGFVVSSKAALSTLVQALHAGLGAAFPIGHLYSVWRNKEGQVSHLYSVWRNMEGQVSHLYSVWRNKEGQVVQRLEE